MAELAQPSPREWPQERQEMAADAAELVREFRDATTSRLSTVDELAERDDTDIEELFASSFGEKVEENREEWLEALDDLEAAFEAYSRGSSEPVEAHPYDLFEYYDSVKGTQHFASNGILYMTYYFDKLEEPEQMRFDEESDSQRQRLIADLASGLEEYVDLASEIENRCEEVASEIPSDWEDRAIAEITTKGYQPNHKHGVVINILPLVNSEIVPETVDNKVV
jgi:hypothetical protein